ncbi:hypothetical protein [Streptomyces sp. NBC_01601]|uniref:hypothetical protein n=1 Tax=Streptomyces sp. NBC_01601 TaxID=2975892 RepID=UPI002E2D9380|nr:hypothetical protein [Streptomyces sp. NBC_01601]
MSGPIKIKYWRLLALPRRYPHHGGEADPAALEAREQRAAELVTAWARPGAAVRDHVELLLCGGWFASLTLAHAFRFDGDRMQEYVESHARALILAGRR